jgi:hypothetical protein
MNPAGKHDGGVRGLDPSVCATADLLNLGAGSGSWLLQEARRLGVEHPIGIDRNRGKVTRAQADGLPVYEADFTDLEPADFPAVKIVVFDNVLEHFPSLLAVEEVFDRACAMASHVVYIRHPSFEHEDYLASRGMKQYWTDWPGVHITHIRLHDFVAMAERNHVYDFAVRPLMRAVDSGDPTILPLGAPPNQHKPVRGLGAYGVYDEAAHGPKPTIRFDRPVYFAFDVFFFLRHDAPVVRYPRDTETALARPFLEWGARDADPADATMRARARRVTRGLRRRAGS